LLFHKSYANIGKWEDKMKRYERILKALSEEKRLKVFALLLHMGGEYYVCEIADALEEFHYNVSKYLKELKMVDLVEENRIGKGVLYSVKEPKDEFLKNLYDAILSIKNEDLEKAKELLKLRVSLREENKCVMRKHPKWEEIVKEVKIK